MGLFQAIARLRARQGGGERYGPFEDLDEDDLVWELVGGEALRGVHAEAICFGQRQPCCIHNPSAHHMAEWRQHWRGDRGLMERICPHGIGHPDPDDISTETVHGCDGCCTRPVVGLPKSSFDVV